MLVYYKQTVTQFAPWPKVFSGSLKYSPVNPLASIPFDNREVLTGFPFIQILIFCSAKPLLRHH